MWRKSTIKVKLFIHLVSFHFQGDIMTFCVTMGLFVKTWPRRLQIDSKTFPESSRHNSKSIQVNITYRYCLFFACVKTYWNEIKDFPQTSEQQFCSSFSFYTGMLQHDENVALEHRELRVRKALWLEARLDLPSLGKASRPIDKRKKELVMRLMRPSRKERKKKTWSWTKRWPIREEFKEHKKTVAIKQIHQNLQFIIYLVTLTSEKWRGGSQMTLHYKFHQIVWLNLA